MGTVPVTVAAVPGHWPSNHGPRQVDPEFELAGADSVRPPGGGARIQSYTDDITRHFFQLREYDFKIVRTLNRSLSRVVVPETGPRTNIVTVTVAGPAGPGASEPAARRRGAPAPLQVGQSQCQFKFTALLLCSRQAAGGPPSRSIIHPAVHRHINGEVNILCCCLYNLYWNVNMRLRNYQVRIVKSALKHGNTIVVLPTGAGKTLIAAEIIRELGSPSLFVVPTCLLVSQQAKALREWTKYDVCEFMGGCTFPTAFEVLVSTPQAFLTEQSKQGDGLCWSSFKCIVFDEVHHVLKEHPYRKIAISLQHQSILQPCIIGLTASLTYAVGENKINKAIRSICEELRIKRLETASAEEMRTEGYHATRLEAEVRQVDVRFAVLDRVVPPEQRKPHLMLQTFLQRQRQGNSTSASAAIFACIRAMESELARTNPDFKSPIESQPVKAWGSSAHLRAKRCPRSAELEHWYEAARILVVSWEEAEDAAFTFLQMNRGALCQPAWSPETAGAAMRALNSAPPTFPRFENLKAALLDELDRRADFRGLLFVQQRVTTHVLDHFVQNDPELSARLRPVCLYATSSASDGATPSLFVSAAQARERLAAFSSGAANLLITTAVAEEGMDVPAANCVLRFDPALTPVSFVQMRGRARQEKSSLVVLSERQDRTTADLVEAEQQQLSLVAAFQPCVAGLTDQQAAEAQRSRERAAWACLEAHRGRGLQEAEAEGAGTLGLWCRKTKVQMQETYAQLHTSEWTCELRYVSVLRSLQSTGKGQTKKAARGQAVSRMLSSLLAISSR